MTWPEALDAFEASLDEHRRALEDGGAPPPPALGPDLPGAEHLGPLPPELAERARELLRRCRRLEAEVEVRRSLLARRMAVATPDGSVRPPACYVDTTA